MSEEGNTQVKDDVRQHQLAANLGKLYLKAESAMELRNWSYAVSLIQAILVKEPGFSRRSQASSHRRSQGK